MMSERKDYFYMMLRDVLINAKALESIQDFEPNCDEIDAMEALHDEIGIHFDLHMVSDSSMSPPSVNREHWLKLQRHQKENAYA